MYHDPAIARMANQLVVVCAGTSFIRSQDLYRDDATEFATRYWYYLKQHSNIAKMPQAQPELKKVCQSILVWPWSFWSLTRVDVQYMEKRVFCQLNGNRKVIGVLRGYDVRLTHPLSLVIVEIQRRLSDRASDYRSS